MNDQETAIKIARKVSENGGRAYFVGGCVRDQLLNVPCKDIDVEVYGIAPQTLKTLLAQVGEPYEKGASFGVLGLRHSELDIAMPRRESRTGNRHVDFAVNVDPFMKPQEASQRRDFTINAMMYDPLTDELLDFWHGKDDLSKRIIRHVSDGTFADDALRVFRAAQFAARLNATIAAETVALCRSMDVTDLSKERVYDELCKALLKAAKPSVFFACLDQMNHLREFFPEIEALQAVPQNPTYHPEGNVLIHTMQVLDAGASLRNQAKEPLAFMLACLCHDLGKTDATNIDENGKITSYEHPITGVPIAERQLHRLTNNTHVLAYVANMISLHMIPNMLAASHSRAKKTRMLFDRCVCPEDLLLLARADADGRLHDQYDAERGNYLQNRLADYYKRVAMPMLTGADLMAAGYPVGKQMGELVKRARELHFSGLDPKEALKQIMRETPLP